MGGGGAAGGTAAAAIPAGVPARIEPNATKRDKAAPRVFFLVLLALALTWGLVVILSFDQTSSLAAHSGYRAAYARLSGMRGGGTSDSRAAWPSRLARHEPSRPAPAASAERAAAGDGAQPQKSAAPAAAAAAQPQQSVAPSPLPQHPPLAEADTQQLNSAVKDLGTHAIITLVAGNAAARDAVVLVQSLVDVGTRYPIVVMAQQGGIGSPECKDSKRRHRLNRHVDCAGNETNADEIMSPFYVKILRRLGAHILVTPQIPRTPYTSKISGGTQLFWGMSLNRLQIFKFTTFKKLLYLDSDTMVFQNIDHLLGPEYPMFTAAMTYSCCNPNKSPYVSGGMWVIEPSQQLWDRAWQLMVEGKPVYDADGQPKLHPNSSKVMRAMWELSDLDIARALFSTVDHRHDSDELYWPGVEDSRHGYVPGLRLLPQHANQSDAEFAREAMSGKNRKLRLPEGFRPDKWDGVTPVWRALDLRYDQCVGNCECMPGRDMREAYITIHFSCMQYGMRKPGSYETEHEFMHELYYRAVSCTRWYFLGKYYEALVRAGARLDPPYWDGPRVPLQNETHDNTVVREYRRQLKAKGQGDGVRVW